MSTIRSFIAIPLNAEIIFRIEKTQKELKTLPADVKWVNPRSIHLTLKFLGNVEEGDIENIAQGIQNGIKGFKPWSAAHIKSAVTMLIVHDRRKDMGGKFGVVNISPVQGVGKSDYPGFGVILQTLVKIFPRVSKLKASLSTKVSSGYRKTTGRAHG